MLKLKRSLTMGAADFTEVAELVYTRQLSQATGSFSDPRVILVTPNDRRAYPMARTDGTSCYIGWAHDGPAYVTIGPDAADSGLTKVSKEYSVPLADLQRFRNTQRPAPPK
jgi:hypothetical protein